MKIYFVISWHINGPAVIQCGMKYRNRIILRHIDLIQNTESAFLSTLVNASLTQLHLIIHESICSNQVTAVCIHMKGHVIHRSPENICQIFCQHILSRSLRSCQKQILLLQHRCHGHLQCFLPIKWQRRLYPSVLRFL